MTGSELIAAERLRQIHEKGYDAAHDDRHDYGVLAIIAAGLAVQHTDATVSDPRLRVDGRSDVWDLAQKHRYDHIRCLTIAGALIAAEIDRLQRDEGSED